MKRAETHDELWNAAQIQMVRYGWMHNYLRMYWAKKILEWTPDVATAMKYCDLSERQVFSGWARSEWICGDCVGDAGEVRPGVGRAAGVREDSVYVGRVDGEEVRFEAVYSADGVSCGWIAVFWCMIFIACMTYPLPLHPVLCKVFIYLYLGPDLGRKIF